MAALIVAVGAALYVTAEKIHDHREKKRALKAKEALRHGSEDDSIIDTATANDHMDNLPAYHKGNLPPYHMVDQHPGPTPNNQIAGSSHRY
ncbi:uncharacterized protein GIQ15_01014 [Arthroderma uncinatum]|uniref:uncharacterized protein n=1 Tax=Arthroderma uncinatum TaxID=74035 RepID=UPI00144A5B75|nr:uncharacterized protein GIQ15_01014 [Arthroderma uncinatum]KAF3491497.1 hypothetical protein GIQ15_01014 [Arthroderma uncinatum]